MKPKIFQWLAIVLIIEIGLIHLFKAQAEFDEAAYMGFLFAANFLVSVIAALAIHRNLELGWVLGTIVAMGSVAGYIWSRTFGMPGMNIEEWISPYGIASLVLEVGFVYLYFRRPRQVPHQEMSIVPRPELRFMIPGASLLVVLLLSGGLYRADYWFTQEYGHHVGSLGRVCRTLPTSGSDLEEKYGIEVSRVATSMMGSIVDVRIKIIDPAKADSFLQNQAALLVNNEVLILAPHLHSHTGSRLKAGKAFILFFPTQQIIRPGTEVNLVFGSTRIESVIVQ